MYHCHKLKKMAIFFWPGTAVQRYKANFILEEVPQNRVTEVQATKKTANLFWQGTAVQRYRANFILEEAILFPKYRGTEVQATNVQNVAINTTSEKYRGT